MKPVKHSVAVAVLGEGDRFCVVKRPDDPDDPLACVWGLPAITLHDSEPERAGVLRTGLAKLGVALAPGRKIGEMTADRGGYLLHLSDFEATIVSGTPSVPQADTSMTQYVDWRFTDDPAILDEAAAKGSLCAQIFLANLADPRGLPGWCAQPEAALLDHQAAVLHVAVTTRCPVPCPGVWRPSRRMAHTALMPEVSDAYLEAMRHGFEFARAMGRRQARPVDVLVGVAAAEASLLPGPGQSPRDVAARLFGGGNGAGYLHGQAQEAAQELARRLGQPPGPAHLLIALIDQGDPEVVAVLEGAGRDPRAVRAHAAAAMGVQGDLPVVPMPPLAALAPAGTMDRPPLPPQALDGRALEAVRWRAEHLPVHLARGPRGRAALARLEAREAERIAVRLGLDDDQAYSLMALHRAEVDRRTGAPRPEGPRPRRRVRRPPRSLAGRAAWRAARLTTGWGVWFGNRRAGLHGRWFRLRTARYYRGQPL